MAFRTHPQESEAFAGHGNPQQVTPDLGWPVLRSYTPSEVQAWLPKPGSASLPLPQQEAHEHGPPPLLGHGLKAIWQ